MTETTIMQNTALRVPVPGLSVGEIIYDEEDNDYYLEAGVFYWDVDELKNIVSLMEKLIDELYDD